jgi:SAM-dependent methyltransferase
MVITAIEPGSQLCRKLRRIENVTVINGYIEKVRLSRKFDLVIMSHVLEHLVDPVQTLRYAYDTFLKKGGVLYIDVPTRDYELRSADAAAVAPESHLVFFDGQGLKQVLALIGFAENRIEGAKYSSLPPSFIHRMEKIGRMKGSNKRGVSLFIYKLMNKASLLVLNAYRTAFSVTPEEIGLDETDYRYNNMAIAARK